MNRRRYLTLTTGGLLAGISPARAEVIDPVKQFMSDHKAPGLSYAIAKDGKILKQRALGFANLETKETLTPQHRFRIASISKPITASAIFLLIEQGKLTLDAPVFGEKGFLEGPAESGITIHHLLNHTSGGWTNSHRDPMFLQDSLNHAELIAWTFAHILPEHQPGKSYAYSNFGYCLLGRVIEKISGQSYEEFVRKNILAPSGAAGMTVGSGRREVSYYTQGRPDTYKMNVPRMDSHGGWVGTPGEMLAFALHVDGFAQPADLLNEESLKLMTTPGSVNEGYACGWNVNKHGNYWHSGSLPGLTSILVRTRGGYCWAACVNTRGESLGSALDQLMWQIAKTD
ncbi:serine hydrolase domain-containing protein [Verrucomicrobiaceae bacterium 227]